MSSVFFPHTSQTLNQPHSPSANHTKIFGRTKTKLWSHLSFGKKLQDVKNPQTTQRVRGKEISVREYGYEMYLQFYWVKT